MLVTLKRRQWGFNGHELGREGGKERMIIEAEKTGKRTRERKRSKCWLVKRPGIRNEKKVLKDTKTQK